jgi:hypothetical protein
VRGRCQARDRYRSTARKSIRLGWAVDRMLSRPSRISQGAALQWDSPAHSTCATLHQMILNAILATASLCIGAWIASVLQSLPPVVPLKKVKDYQGRHVTVCGRVVTHDCASKDRATTLDLDNPYWSRPVAVLITEQARSSFPPRLEDRYVLGTICATGVVEHYEGRYVVRVERQDQITVEKAPPVTPFGLNSVRPCDHDVEMPQLTYEVQPNYTSPCSRHRGKPHKKPQ